MFLGKGSVPLLCKHMHIWIQLCLVAMEGLGEVGFQMTTKSIHEEGKRTGT